MKTIFNPLRERGAGNLVLDALFVLWAVYFLASGRLVPNVLIWGNEPSTKAIATHPADRGLPAQVQPANKDEVEPGWPANVEGEDGAT